MATATKPKAPKTGAAIDTKAPAYKCAKAMYNQLDKLGYVDLSWTEVEDGNPSDVKKLIGVVKKFFPAPDAADST